MFFNSIPLSPEITDETTLEEFLDDDFVIQNVIGRTPNVMNYLLNSDRIFQMIDLIVDQSNITYDTTRFKYPSVAAEILSCGVPSIVDFLVSDGNKPNADGDASAVTSAPASLPFVDNLLAFIDTALPLNPLSASFFTKIMTNILYTRANVMVPYLRTRRKDFLPNLVRHIDSPAICELIIDMTKQENNQQHTVAEWFLECEVFTKLLDLLSPSANESPERQEAAGRCLVELVSIYRGHVSYTSTEGNTDDDFTATDENEQRPEAVLLAKSLAILDIFEGAPFISRLIDMIADKSATTTVRHWAIEVFLACVDKGKSPQGQPPCDGSESNENSLPDGEAAPSDRMPRGAGGFNSLQNLLNPGLSRTNCPLLQTRIKCVEAVAASVAVPRLPALYSLLSSSSSNSSSSSSVSSKDGHSATLGRMRLAVANLVSVLPQLGSGEGSFGSRDELGKALCKEGFTTCLMSLFEQYAFNSLLHKAVTNFFRHLLTPPNPRSRRDSTVTSVAVAASINDERKGEEKEKTAEPSTNTKSPKSGNALKESEEQPVELPDYLKRHLLEDCRILQWILRLSCIPEDRPSDADPTIVCRLSKTRPKPGYSGHLWQIANLIKSCFPTAESLTGVPSDVVSKWQNFVQNDLTVINEAQVVTKVEGLFEKSTTISLDALRIGADSQVAQLFKLLQTSSDLQSFASKLSEFTGQVRALQRPEPNAEVFDDPEEEQQQQVDEEGKGTPSKRPQSTSSDIDEDEDGPNAGPDSDEAVHNSSSASSPSSDEEEDLVSPVVIRQQRSNEAPAPPLLLNASANGRLASRSGAVAKSAINHSTSVDFLPTLAEAFCPWAPEATKLASPDTTAASSDTSNSALGDDNWADFESASFGGSGTSGQNI